MYKELRKRIKKSRPIAKRQKVLNIALLASVLASVAVLLWSVAVDNIKCPTSKKALAELNKR